MLIIILLTCCSAFTVNPPSVRVNRMKLPMIGLSEVSSMSQSEAETLASPFFGGSLFPYLGFLYYLKQPQCETPRGVWVGFASLLSFVILTIPAAVAAKLLFDAGLADVDWLHGSAESLLTITNLVTVLSFRQAFRNNTTFTVDLNNNNEGNSVAVNLVVALTLLALIPTCILPGILHTPAIHDSYLNGFLDLPFKFSSEPSNALSISTWLIHVSSLIEFLVVMGFCFEWAKVTGNERWKGLAVALVPLHSSGLVACTYHLFYNSNYVLLPLQAALTFFGNCCVMAGAWRIANGAIVAKEGEEAREFLTSTKAAKVDGFEDLGIVFSDDNDALFLSKVFLICLTLSYGIKYGSILGVPYLANNENVALPLAVILLPTLFNLKKWTARD